MVPFWMETTLSISDDSYMINWFNCQEYQETFSEVCDSFIIYEHMYVSNWDILTIHVDSTSLQLKSGS